MLVIKMEAELHRLRPLSGPAACRHRSVLKLSLSVLLSACSPV